MQFTLKRNQLSVMLGLILFSPFLYAAEPGPCITDADGNIVVTPVDDSNPDMPVGGCVAAGVGASSSGGYATAIGESAAASGEDSAAFGHLANASAINATAIGAYSIANKADASAFGRGAAAEGLQSTAIGTLAWARKQNGTAVGYNSTTGNLDASAFGALANASGQSSIAIGSMTKASGVGSIAIGYNAMAYQQGATVIGISNSDQYININTVFYGGTLAADSIREYPPLVYSTVVFGAANMGGKYFKLSQLKGVASGADDFDAVNLAQLKALGNNIASWFGGGASISATGVFTPPSFSIGGNSYTTVGAAFDAVNTSLSAITTRIDGIEQAPGPAGAAGASAYDIAVKNGFAGSETEWLASLKGDTGDTGPAGPKGDKGDQGIPGTDGKDGAKGDTGDTGPAGPEGQSGKDGPKGEKGDRGPEGPQGPEGQAGKDGADGKNGSKGDSGADGSNGADGKDGEPAPKPELDYSDEKREAVALNKSGAAVRLSNLAEGTQGNDAATLSQLKRESDNAVKRANEYTDNRIADVTAQFDDRWDDMEGRVAQVNRDLEGLGAMTSAMAMMGAAAVDSSAPVSAQIGFGTYGNRAAVAIGLKARLGERAGMSFGLANDGKKTMGGVGFSIGID